MTDAKVLRSELSRAFRSQVLSAGFDSVGLAPATPGLGRERLLDWLAAGKQGEMTYMAQQADARLDPNLVLANVRSVVVATSLYSTTQPGEVTPGTGRISRYAWGDDYHELLRRRLNGVVTELTKQFPHLGCRAVVDSAPVMERDYAVLAGLGWIGKNCLLIHPKLGSWFFLGAILVDVDLDYDAPFTTDHCGSCTLCLEACPTGAFTGPWELDPRRCISYWTIESRTAPPEEMRGQFGDWLFGCDICQSVCPWNRRAPTVSEPAFQPAPERNPVSLSWLLRLTDAEFRARFRGTPLFRAKRARVLRNACWVAANQGATELLPELRALTTDPDADLASAASWAMERLGGTEQSS